ncbi:hypothetical protein BKM09_019010 [Pseudomonas amygdali pv. morsprunorum]|uniref:Uncharacterized protein n=1 Tax=Pseudomonas amygdali pv. eriobotryae TaxID=129137 RepID=A0A9P3A9P6_PSEA0|nr:hypothetical protein BKM19_007375 [Pseudomonas amygdali pv. morsprunorum]POP92684.1 hypothetical protein CXB39_14850 [Pseudomonas amygdali pv. morsprunorum]POY80615.1 hypothetical protein BKM09_019010 [Pseudomonas amygdali pv. morsprunorum]GFZ58509.1 hypothetical protein PSE10A_10200 [Pseudomonas amygdali pv. eriobotryae]GFZ71885.1 hypothetical protein PSE10C_26270 [Pseudomonas amygdali pv. eriobotryae]
MLVMHPCSIASDVEDSSPLDAGIRKFAKQYSAVWPIRNEVSGVMAECYLDQIVQQCEAADT